MRAKNDVGIIGLGKMGFRMAEHLIEQAYALSAYDIDTNLMDAIRKKGASVFRSPEELVQGMETPRMILVSIPADEVESLIDEIGKYLSSGDIIIESGNCFYQDSQRRAKKLLEKGIFFLDVGISGGVNGARHGACLMIGGNREAFLAAEDIFNALSKDGSYLYLGKSGAGHLVKGYHNFVEYGFLESLAEGLAALKSISEKEGLGITPKAVCKIWCKGSIVQSRIVSDAEKAFADNPDLEGISGSVKGQTHGEMEKLTEIAEERGVATPACSAAIAVRKDSQSNPAYIGKIINAARNIFGGHQEWKQDLKKQ